MKTQLSIIISFLFISFCSIAQKGNELKTEKIKVWGNCDMCKTKIEKAAKSAGASYALWNEESKMLTVKYASAKTTNSKIQKKIASVGYDTQDETAKDEVYNNLHGCCQYERKNAKEATVDGACCTDKASCAKNCAHKEGQVCCKDKKESCTKECCVKSTASCCKDAAACTKDCCTKADMSCCKAKNANSDCCKNGNKCCTK